jgi:5-methylcytosine-specific restriction endonuclease McrA
MKINKKDITVRELSKSYIDKNDEGVFGYDNRLTIRPLFQREFVYNDKQRAAVIDTVMKGFPLNVMYWNITGDDTYEVLDGQQRTISLCQYINGDFPVKMNGNDRFFHNLTETEKEKVLSYPLIVFVCDGTEEEKLAWFRTINIAGATLTNQELLNATFTGSWLTDAKKYFSKRNCAVSQMGEGFVKGNPLRQEYLEKVLSWIADRDKLENGASYMALHQHDADANELWLYYQEVIAWAKRLFPNINKKLTETQEWGLLYNKYKDNNYNTNDLERDVKALLLDDDIEKKTGIIPYLLSNKAVSEEKLLSLRAFSDNMKLKKYEEQGHKCPLCVKENIDKEYDFSEMEGDHIVPWSRGGHTEYNNLQMLCERHNREKSAK